MTTVFRVDMLLSFFCTFGWLQENIRRCVCIIYDPSRANQGALALKALKLSDSFMELYRNNNFTGEKYDNLMFNWNLFVCIFTV